jgi:hypothetical protein
VTAGAAVAAPIRSATRAVYAAFTLMGFASASWAARIPQVRDGMVTQVMNGLLQD